MSSDFEIVNGSLDKDGSEFHEISETSALEASETTELDYALEEAFPRDVAQIGELDIGNFSESGFTDCAEVQDYIESNIPAEHLEDLDSIEYVNDQDAYESGLMGMWVYDPFLGEIYIEIYPHDDKGIMYDTIAHEIGHNAEAVLQDHNPQAVETWNQMYAETLGNLIASGGFENEFVTPYSTVSPEEDFAESYCTYINDPELLQFVSPDKYDFMRDQVFGGQEFSEA